MPLHNAALNSLDWITWFSSLSEMGPQILHAYDRMTARSDRKEKDFYPTYLIKYNCRGRKETLRIFSKAGSLGQISTEGTCLQREHVSRGNMSPEGTCLDTPGMHESWLYVYNSVVISDAYISSWILRPICSNIIGMYTILRAIP